MGIHLSNSDTSISPSNNFLLQAFQDALSASGQACSNSVLLAGLPEGEQISMQWLARASARHGLNARLLELTADTTWPDSCELLVTLKGGGFTDAVARVTRSGCDSNQYQCSVYRAGKEIEQHELELSELVANTTSAMLVGPMISIETESGTRRFSGWLISEFWRMRSVYRDVLLATVLLNVFVVVSPLFVMNVYDRVVPNQAFETLWALAIGVIIVLVFDLVVKLLRQYFIESASKQIDVVLSTRLFDHVMNKKPGSVPPSVGAFASQFKEFDAIKQFFTAASFSALIDLPFALFFMLVIYSLGGSLVMVPLIAAVTILGYGLLLHFPLKAIVQQVQQSSAMQNATLVESLTVFETLKAFNAEGRAQGRWEQATLLNAQLGLRARRLGDSVALVSGFVMQCSMLGVVIMGVYQIADYEMSLGALIACVLLGNRAISPMVQVASLSAQYFQARAALTSLDEITAGELEQTASRSYLNHEQFRGEFQLQDLSFAYDDGQAILRDLNLKVKPGEHVALIGKIGSGKSTLLKLMAGLLVPTRGQLSIDGIGAPQINPIIRRNNCAYVPQDIALVSGTLRENIALKNRHCSDDELLRSVQANRLD